MITLRTISYIVGLTIAISSFGIFLFMTIPGMIQHNQWDEIDMLDITEEELIELFQGEPAYVAFYEKFPEAKEEFNQHKYGGSEMTVGITNFENNHMLRLNMNYNNDEGKVWVNVWCETNSDRHSNADGLFAIEFIQNTKCLEDSEPLIVPSHLD